jgi:hypothetical protein
MLTDEEKKEIRDLVADAITAGIRSNNCICNLSSEAQSELAHLMGMVKDIGHDSYPAGIEVLRQNNRVLMRFRARVDKLSQGIAWLIIASGVGGVLWLLGEGCKTAIKAVKGG